MTVTLTISLPDELAEHAKEMVRERRAASVSGAVAALLAEDRARSPYRALLDEWLDDSGGAPSREEVAWVAAVLDAGAA